MTVTVLRRDQDVSGMTNGDDDGGDDDKDDEMITATAAAVSDRLGLPASAEAQRPTGARPAPV